MTINSVDDFLDLYGCDQDTANLIISSLNDPLSLSYSPEVIKKFRQLHVFTHGFSTEIFHHLYRSFYAKHKYYTHIDSLIQTYTESYRPQFNKHLFNLRTNGFTVLESFFSPAVCKSVQDYLLSSVAFRNDRDRSHKFSGHDILAKSPLSVLDSSVLNHSLRFISQPHSYDFVDSLKYHPFLLSLVSNYLGSAAISEPSLSFLSLPSVSNSTISHSNSIMAKSSSAQVFHFDFDHIKWLKIFVNWTDIGKNNGPHQFLNSTHLRYPSSLDPRSLSLHEQSEFDSLL